MGISPENVFYIRPTFRIVHQSKATTHMTLPNLNFDDV